LASGTTRRQQARLTFCQHSISVVYEAADQVFHARGIASLAKNRDEYVTAHASMHETGTAESFPLKIKRETWEFKNPLGREADAHAGISRFS
jgi:hypothetical protein